MPQAAKPAMTSGPGALSRRIDGGLASKQAQRYVSGMPSYGDGQDLMNLQAQAPMAQTRIGSNPPSPSAMAQMAQQGGQPQQQQQQAQPQQPITPLSAPTQRPNEPVTTGSPLGAGAGPEALGIMPGQVTQGGQSAKNLVQALASNRDASPELQALASKLGK